MGPFLSFGFVDPDGVGHEVMWTKPGASSANTLKRTEWTVVAEAGAAR